MEIIIFENTSEYGERSNNFQPITAEYLCEDGDVVGGIDWGHVSAYLCELPKGYYIGKGKDGFRHLYKEEDAAALDDWPIKDHLQGYLLDMYTDFAVLKKIRELEPDEIEKSDHRRVGTLWNERA